ncbi:hypothetical protein [Aquitalea aquatilis]|uniref:hypothetical protein n=1 Tax=Aquitalea aquatilis TaxID=1537400 RepID=UPI0010BD1510|nr:hypothetical protein [Aquitalea aquatilis]
MLCLLSPAGMSRKRLLYTPPTVFVSLALLPAALPFLLSELFVTWCHTMSSLLNLLQMVIIRTSMHIFPLGGCFQSKKKNDVEWFASLLAAISGKWGALRSCWLGPCCLALREADSRGAGAFRAGSLSIAHGWSHQPVPWLV